VNLRISGHLRHSAEGLTAVQAGIPMEEAIKTLATFSHYIFLEQLETIWNNLKQHTPLITLSPSLSLFVTPSLPLTTHHSPLTSHFLPLSVPTGRFVFCTMDAELKNYLLASGIRINLSAYQL